MTIQNNATGTDFLMPGQELDLGPTETADTHPQPEEPFPGPEAGHVMEGTPEYDHAQAENGHGDSEPITDINELDLRTEPMEDVDESKLADRLEYAPSLAPGKWYNAIFKLDEEKPVVGITMKGKIVASFNYTASIINEDGTPGKDIRFLNANMFRSGKMEASRAEELLFALGKLREFKQTARKPSDVKVLLEAATGEQKVIRVQIQWRRYEKETGQTWSTAPAKPYTKKTKDGGEINVVELPWPKDAKGKFNPRPEEFEGNYGSETVSRVAPTKETLEESKQAAA